ncbi:MAG: mechanosensitive ion channel [Eggerthellaceae bacterium]|nr:mechanosensitive ion channel [Eggerthellaceae bacterium]
MSNDLLVRIGIAFIILIVTALISWAARRILKRVLKNTSLLPTSTIFLNIVRVIIWIIGISGILSFCFKIDVTAIITALGVGGIAVSLGFQDTISNLIGGLTVSVSREIEPGDNIQMGTSGVTGFVSDVTWRQTIVDDSSGNHIVIPNSIMTTTAVVKKPPLTNVTIPIVVTASDERLSEVAHHMESAAEKAVERICKMKKKPTINFSEITEYGFKGKMSFTVEDVDKVTYATDAAVRAIAPFAHEHYFEASNVLLDLLARDFKEIIEKQKENGGVKPTIETDQNGAHLNVTETVEQSADAILDKDALRAQSTRTEYEDELTERIVKQAKEATREQFQEQEKEVEQSEDIPHRKNTHILDLRNIKCKIRRRRQEGLKTYGIKSKK